MAIENLETTLEPLFVCFKQQRQLDESFGDFCHRVGFEALRNFAATYQPEVSASEVTLPEATMSEVAVSEVAVSEVAVSDAPVSEVAVSEAPATVSKSRHRIGIRFETYERLKAASLEQGKPMSEIVNAALELYLQSLDQ
jgi:sulfite reductase (ferredoxin)